MGGIIHEDRKSKQWISDIKYSPDGFTLAIGSHDNTIYLHDVNNSYTVRAMCTKHNSFITHFDFSMDSATLQSNCGAYELLFYNTVDGTQNPSASSVKNVEWSTWTCPLGWPVQGIWPDESEGLNIYSYPCLEKGAKNIEGRGHSSHVTNVRFNKVDSHLVTLGGNDRSVFVWKLTKQA